MSRSLHKVLRSQLMGGASALAITGLVSAGLPVMAQDTRSDDDDQKFGIEEIIVTATKRAKSVQDVAQSITAFSTAEIERRGILDMADIASALPSISLSSSRAGLNELVYRGISTGNSWRLDSQVAVYLDDTPMTASTTQLDPRMVDIERVESLPGPQGTLFGSSSQSGTLRIITNKPNFDGFSGQMNAEVKSTKSGEKSYDFSGHLNIPVSDTFALRVVGYYAKDGGYIDNVLAHAPHSACGPNGDCAAHAYEGGHLTAAVQDNAAYLEDNFNDYTSKGGRISALWNVSDDWNVLAAVLHQESETTGVWYNDTALGDYKVARFSDEWRTDKWTTYALTVKGDLGWAELSNSFSYVERNQQYSFDNTHYEAEHTAYGKYWAYWYPIYDVNGSTAHGFSYYDLFITDYNGGTYESLQEATRFSNEFRLQSSGNSRFEWMVGAYYEKNEDGWVDRAVIPNLKSTRSYEFAQWVLADLNAQGYDVPSSLPESGNDWYRDQFERTKKQVAFFGEFGYDVTEKLHVLAGIRWFQYDRLVENLKEWPPGLPVLDSVYDGTGSTSTEKGKESDTALKLTVQYTIDDDRMIYAGFSQGFRSGGRNSTKSIKAGFVPEYFNSDKLNNFEAGLKSEWFDNRLQINASVFLMKWNDIQLSIRSPEGKWWLRGQVNGGGGKSYGAELDFNAAVTQDFRLSGQFYIGSSTYSDDYINPVSDTTEFTHTQFLGAGDPMIDAAKKKFTLSADYTIRDVFKGADMYLRYDFQYMGGLYSSRGSAQTWCPSLGDSEYDEDCMPSTGTPDFNVDSFTKSNFQIGLEMDNDLTAIFMVRNLFDATANTSTGDPNYYANDYWDNAQGLWGETNNLARPRTISFKLIKKF